MINPMSKESTQLPGSYWVRRRREQDAALADTTKAWTSFVENEANPAADGTLLEQRAS